MHRGPVDGTGKAENPLGTQKKCPKAHTRAQPRVRRGEVTAVFIPKGFQSRLRRAVRNERLDVKMRSGRRDRSVFLSL